MWKTILCICGCVSRDWVYVVAILVVGQPKDVWVIKHWLGVWEELVRGREGFHVRHFLLLWVHKFQKLCQSQQWRSFQKQDQFGAVPSVSCPVTTKTVGATLSYWWYASITELQTCWWHDHNSPIKCLEFLSNFFSLLATCCELSIK